jgi:acyl-CoA reductase-like NAD-dependent aldehyde dehydrogenase
MLSRDAIYIGGEWVRSAGSERLAVTDPTTEKVVAEIPAGTAEDVDAAAHAAAAARDDWGARSFSERAKYVAAIADGLARRRDELVQLIVTEVGTPRRAAEAMQVDIAIQTFRDVAEFAGAWEHEEQVANSAVERVAAGVAGLITPWNYPLYQIALKVAPALAAGCPVVLKPSEVAPLNALVLAEIIHEAALPPGVFNLVSGTGPVVGEAIVRNPVVDVVSFTGSVRAGKRVASLAGEGVKKVTLELGGKGASVVLDGADLNAAITNSVRSCFSNAGQTCAALTRLIVSKDRLADIEAMAREIASAYVVGDPRNAETQLGPVVSSTQRERVLSFIAKGEAEGAKTVLGAAGRKLPDKGYFVAPTIFSDVAPEMTIAQEEIFGPVLSIIPVEDEDAAIAAANSTRYGLTAAVWARDIEDARRAASQIRAGSVNLNGGKFNPLAPFGGFKQSGFGRERGRFGIEEYLALKAYHA